jgi:hypothetical protein
MPTMMMVMIVVVLVAIVWTTIRITPMRTAAQRL